MISATTATMSANNESRSLWSRAIVLLHSFMGDTVQGNPVRCSAMSRILFIPIRPKRMRRLIAKMGMELFHLGIYHTMRCVVA